MRFPDIRLTIEKGPGSREPGPFVAPVHSTVTVFARLRGLSTSIPRAVAR